MNYLIAEHDTQGSISSYKSLSQGTYIIVPFHVVTGLFVGLVYIAQSFSGASKSVRIEQLTFLPT